MVLHDVAGGADAVVVTGPTADADVLCHRYLDIVDVVAVPDRLVHGVGESHCQDVLDGLLAEIVVNPEDGAGREDFADELVELLGALEVMPERLFDDDTAPGARRTGCET